MLWWSKENSTAPLEVPTRDPDSGETSRGGRSSPFLAIHCDRVHDVHSPPTLARVSTAHVPYWAGTDSEIGPA